MLKIWFLPMYQCICWDDPRLMLDNLLSHLSMSWPNHNCFEKVGELGVTHTHAPNRHLKPVAKINIADELEREFFRVLAQPPVLSQSLPFRQFSGRHSLAFRGGGSEAAFQRRQGTLGYGHSCHHIQHNRYCWMPPPRPKLQPPMIKIAKSDTEEHPPRWVKRFVFFAWKYHWFRFIYDDLKISQSQL